MHRMPLHEILATGSRPASCTQVFAFDAIDFSRPFVHESLTALYYTPVYQTLTPEQQLRYNQLAGMKVNEQFIMLENQLVNWTVPRLLQHPALKSQPELRACLRQMRQEEQKHLGMFRELNRMCLPTVYADTDVYFGELDLPARLFFRVAALIPRQLTCALWLQLLIEEHTVGFSRRMIRGPETAGLGDLEPNFLRLHKEHVKDEYRHVQIDAWLLETFSTSLPARRRLNAALLGRCIRYAVTPAATVRVIHHLVREHPDLRPREDELVAATMALGRNETYQRSLFSRSLTPVTFALLDSQPEFHRLARTLPGYQPTFVEAK